MGKKSKDRGWPEAIRLCALTSHDVEMAKRLGFQPEVLIRAIPAPRQQWKAPVNEWVRNLYWQRFGNVLGQKVVALPTRFEPLDPSHFPTAGDDVPF